VIELYGRSTARARECKLLTGIDDHSRFVVLATVLATPSAREVAEAFTAAMRRYGVPSEVLSDNGGQFTGRFIKPLAMLVDMERVVHIPIHVSELIAANPMPLVGRPKLANSDITPRYGRPTFDRSGAQVRAQCRHLATVVTISGAINAMNIDRVGEYSRRFILQGYQ
jgi:hypothetical protein